ncbi:MAG: hypothetical protein KAT90_02160 [Gammaproteobacteria bacterium]|nr:hypothetical protein [Gammaproteobacteria bacterium]
MSSDTNQNTQNPQNLLQPVVYGVLPNQSNDEINLGALFSKLAGQWKLVLGLTLGGTVLAVLLALILPNVYQPSVTVSLPLSGNVAAVTTIHEFIKGEDNDFPSTPQSVFTNYFNLLRSDRVLIEYIHEKKYLEKLYPDDTEPESVLLTELLDERRVKIEEPAAEKKGGYIANPERVKISIDVEDEAIGVELLNGYSSYVNQKLITDLQNDVRQTIENKLDVLYKQVARQRVQHRQVRVLTIQKMEQENAKEIALVKEQISAYLGKAGANRATRIANAKEALDMAKSLDITYPTTLEALAQKSQKGNSANTAITVVDKQASSLYLQGSKYLSTLIETLTNRKSDEAYLAEINNLREKIHLIKNDQELAALKKRKSDDPWIENLPKKLAQINTLETLIPDFTSLIAYSVDKSAMITNEKIKPKRKLIVVIGFILSLITAIFSAMIIASMKGSKKERN